MQRNEMLASISANNDLDFYYNVKNVHNQYIIDIITEHFDNGERKDHEFTSLEFLNLLWEQSNFVQNNIEKAQTVKTTLQQLPLNEEEKHILLGFILLYEQGGYPITNDNAQYQRTYGFIETAFKSYEGNTPEKIICEKDWFKKKERDKQYNDLMVSLCNTYNPQPKTPESNRKESVMRDAIREGMVEIIKDKKDKESLELLSSMKQKYFDDMVKALDTIEKGKYCVNQLEVMIGEIEGRKGVKKIKDRSEANPKDKKIIETFEELMRTNGNESNVLGLMGTATYNYLEVGKENSTDKNRTDSIRRTLRSYGIIK
jgi:hypothetical protein